MASRGRGGTTKTGAWRQTPRAGPEHVGAGRRREEATGTRRRRRPHFHSIHVGWGPREASAGEPSGNGAGRRRRQRWQARVALRTFWMMKQRGLKAAQQSGVVPGVQSQAAGCRTPPTYGSTMARTRASAHGSPTAAAAARTDRGALVAPGNASSPSPPRPLLTQAQRRRDGEAHFRNKRPLLTDKTRNRLPTAQLSRRSSSRTTSPHATFTPRRVMRAAGISRQTNAI